MLMEETYKDRLKEIRELRMGQIIEENVRLRIIEDFVRKILNDGVLDNYSEDGDLKTVLLILERRELEKNE